MSAHKKARVTAWSVAAHEKKQARHAEMLRKQKAAEDRKRVNYEDDAPRCETCHHFRKEGIELFDSLPRKRPSECKRYGFKAKPTGCCDSWASEDGCVIA